MQVCSPGTGTVPTTAQLDASGGAHETAVTLLNVPVPQGSGREVRAHVVPESTSTIPLPPEPVPTAMHDVADGHDSEVSWSPGAPRVEAVQDPVPPESVSSSGSFCAPASVQEPTARHEVMEKHAMPLATAFVDPPGSAPEEGDQEPVDNVSTSM